MIFIFWHFYSKFKFCCIVYQLDKQNDKVINCYVYSLNNQTVDYMVNF